MLTIAKTVMHGTLCFAIESVAEPLVFVKKIHAVHVFTIKNRWLRAAESTLGSAIAHTDIVDDV